MLSESLREWLRAVATQSVRPRLSTASLVVRTVLFAAVGLLLPAGRRDPSIWVFGARGGDGFVDNTKYLFLHVAEERPQVRAVWLSRDDQVVATLRANGYQAHHVHSLTGVYLNLRAGVVVLSQGLRDVNLACSGGAAIVQLWHGVPLKTIAWDAEIPTLSLPERLVNAYLFSRTDAVMVTSSALVDVFADAFRIDPERVVVAGYPRLDALVESVPGEDVGVDQVTAAEVRRVGADHAVIAYLPTYRAEPERRASAHLDFDALQRFLEARDAYLLVKFHPFEEVDLDGREHSRIVHVPPASDVYPLLREVDALVTDYSSVAFDFLSRDRPIVYYPYDHDRYRARRGFYFDYEAVAPGPRATDFESLLDAMDAALSGDGFGDERRAVRDRFFRGVDDTHAATVFRAIRARLEERD